MFFFLYKCSLTTKDFVGGTNSNYPDAGQVLFSTPPPSGTEATSHLMRALGCPNKVFGFFNNSDNYL